MTIISSDILAKGRKFICALFACSSLIAVAPATAEPQVSQEQIATYQAADEGRRIHILIQLAKAGFVNAAEMLLHRFPLQGPFAQNRTLYVEGLILESRHQWAPAAAKFRQALANDPKLSLVRAELARVLVAEGERDSAKHHLDLLASDAPDPAQAAAIRSFVAQLDRNHPWKFSGYISVAPSTNINEGSSHSTQCDPQLANLVNISFDPCGEIDPNYQKKTGIGISAGGSVGYVKDIGNRMQAVLAANIGGTYYPLTGATTLGLGQSAELRFGLDKGYVGLGGIASEGIDTRNLSIGYKSYGPRISMSYFLSPRDQLYATGTYQWRDYGQGPTSSSVAINAVLTHALDSSSNVALITGFDRRNQQPAYNSYSGGTIGLGFYKELPSGFTVEGQGTAHFAFFDEDYGFKNFKRQDERLTGSLTFTKRDWNWFGFAPSLNYTYIRNFSNVELFDLDSHSVDFTLTKDF